jgi:hypothetical protein
MCAAYVVVDVFRMSLDLSHGSISALPIITLEESGYVSEAG